ncbi:uncharacterized protein LY79DRAFT_553379 [Colletotrichum navitas]|uniref:Uncharacterized protein n=1 Tax=Colletotrichum navitas TaxID=681940 RepID=A0AAD8V664_9PEZI|nr:uncharacterized protein LY79DRAFT_553379 [Colletotrichum navitas]KAK1590868.1 hypothetical protein LY79DRAFT_553379 [Colletotrichum navitas]
MIFSEHVNGRNEVVVVSSESGPPRLDLNLTPGRRGTFDSLDSDFDRRFYPRTARSSNDLFAQTLEGMDMMDCDSEWGAVRARARENNDRQGLADLIDFLRTTSPPSGFPSQSVFDEDTNELQELPEKWRLLKKLRRPRTRARSLSPARRPLNAGLPNSAVVSKTSSGKSHIAISIPLEYCHVGPDSDWALAIFNATPPLPPSPPARKSDDETDNAAVRPYASERKVTVLKTVSEKGSISTINTVNTISTRMGTKGSVSIWPKITPNPMSPPMTPYTTPPGSLRESSSSKDKHNRIPLAALQYAEIPADPVSTRRRLGGSLDKGHHLGSDEGYLAQVAIPNARKPKVKSSHKRPENITLSPRRSSTKISSPQVDQILNSQHLIGGSNDRNAQHQGVASDVPQLSPTTYSESNSISPSVTTELSEPVVSSARSAKAYSMVSIVRPEMPSTTPRQSCLARPGSSDTAQTTLVGESVASRNASTRTASSRQSRRERVRSIKQRDMEALKSITKQVSQEEDGEVTPRPRTCDTAISSLRLPSRDGTFGCNDHFSLHEIETKLSATNLANMAKSHKKSSHRVSHGTATKISDWQATQEPETPGWETAREELTPGWETAQETPAIDWEKTPILVEMTEDQVISAAASTRTFGNGDARDSTLSSEPPRRWGSLHRASWASSVPLLDRIGSFAPSDESTTQVVEADGSHLPPRRAPKSRADSVTPSQADADQPYLDSFSSRGPGNPAHIDPVDDDQSIAGSIAAFPKPGSGAGPRLSAIMPVAEVVPSAPLDERWSDSALNSPMTVVELSYPPFADDLTPRRSSMPVAHLPTAGNPNMAQPDASRDQRQTNGNNRREPAPVDGNTGGTTALRPPNRSNEEDSVGIANMSSRELRNHYASLRSTRVNDLAHEMLLNQERLEMRMHRQERNQILFIERLQKCMSELQSLPEDPHLDPHPQDWTLNDDEDNIYEGLRISRDPRHEMRARKTVRLNTPNRPLQQYQPGPRHSSRRVMDVAGVFDDFAGDFVEPRQPQQHQQVPREPSMSHDTPRMVRGSRFQAVMSTPMTTRGGLDAMDPLIRELQLAARVSLETTRTERTETSQVGDYSYAIV